MALPGYNSYCQCGVELRFVIFGIKPSKTKTLVNMLHQTKKPSSIRTYVRLLTYLEGLYGRFAISILGFLIFAVSQPALAKVMEEIINAIEAKDADARWALPFIAVGVFFLRGVGSFLGVYFNEYVGASVVTRVKREVFNHLIVLPAEFYNDTSQGAILHRLNTGVGQIQAAVTNALKIMIKEGLTVVCLLGYIFYLNWQLSLVFLVISPLLALIVSVSTKKMKKIARKNERIAGQLVQVSKELISNYSVVRGFGAEEYERKRYGSALDRAFKAQLKIRKITAIFGPISQLIVSAAVAVIVFFILNPTFLNNSTTGELVGYLTAVALLPKSLQQLSGINMIIQRGVVGAEFIFEILDIEPEVDNGDYEVERVDGRIEIENLSFSYPGTDKQVLKNVSFTIEPGEMVALVGKSGSGKTTLASLIFRQYRFSQGCITLDGVDINRFKLSNLRSHIAAVNQNISLFDDTVRNNIAYGDHEYSSEEIHKALIQSHASEFINEMPEGIETVIGENGVKMSGGQRQRLSLARAFLKDSPVLILDEATSALDNESERIVTRAIEELAISRTSLVIAHRLSTIKRANRLIVMQDGEVVEMGKHENLLEKGGYYANLYAAEFQRADSPEASG